jgi:hypothetical protein
MLHLVPKRCRIPSSVVTKTPDWVGSNWAGRTGAGEPGAPQSVQDARLFAARAWVLGIPADRARPWRRSP